MIDIFLIFNHISLFDQLVMLPEALGLHIHTYGQGGIKQGATSTTQVSPLGHFLFTILFLHFLLPLLFFLHFLTSYFNSNYINNIGFKKMLGHNVKFQKVFKIKKIIKS